MHPPFRTNHFPHGSRQPLLTTLNELRTKQTTVGFDLTHEARRQYIHQPWNFILADTAMPLSHTQTIQGNGKAPIYFKKISVR